MSLRGTLAAVLCKSSPILPPLSRSGQYLINSAYLRSRASVTAPTPRKSHP